MYKSIVLMMLIIVAASFTYVKPLTAAQGDKESNVSQTPHNLSSSGGGGPDDVKTTESETEICVFCHTPHGSNNFPGSPLWNRKVNDTYTAYTSASLDAETIMGGSLDSPAGSSKLCLSCHDGLLALGTVNVFAGQTNYTFGMTSAQMPVGEGLDTGFTRNLGSDLTNDHPIGLTYDSAVATADGELYTPGIGTGSNIGLRSPGVKPLVPLEPTGSGGEGQIQCATCHDPHVHDPTATTSIKFLRLNRFQQGPPSPGSFTESNDMVCLACHDKDGWSTSAHADSAVANETYISGAPNLREIPSGLPVWQVGCLNCHDTHTVHGARRLLREGTDGPGDPKVGGDAAIEETCYQCHTSAPIITNANNDVPDIETDFTILNRHMPITSFDQPAVLPERHNITDNDFSESDTLLGALGNPTNRHVECTDCHNPHRVMKDRLFSGDSGDTTEGTHEHASGHTNIASGVLRGIWGVEPIYLGGFEFLDLPSRYEVKDGDGGLGAPAGTYGNAMTYVTREYQVCLKCHSDYGYDDDRQYPSGGRPQPGDSGGTTVAWNDLTEYTNQAMEFQAPVGDQGAPNSDTNHRSWHPVIDKTGRGAQASGGRDMSSSANMFLPPWNGAANIGEQTMYCSDCHGSGTSAGTVVPPGNNPWGPHGSNNEFILKGTWDATTGVDDTGICFRCHNYEGYATNTNQGDVNNFESGWGGGDDSNLHAFHADQIGKNLQCMWCHVAVPHGWKNKAFLVNLNDVGLEAGLSDGTEITINGNNDFYTQGPYYNNAKLKIQNFAESGTWQDSDCGSSGSRGRSWMRDVCDPPGGP